MPRDQRNAAAFTDFAEADHLTPVKGSTLN